MNKNIFAIILATIAVALFSQSALGAVIPNNAPYANGLSYGMASYGSHPINAGYSTYWGSQYPYQSVRIGGWFGANSAYLVGLKPGFYDGPVSNYYTRNMISSNYYPRVGGWYGYGSTGYYYNMRPGTFTYGGIRTNYASPSYYFQGPL
jgi:hypothetical protein